MQFSLKRLFPSAFTLIELLIVITIIGILMALLFPALDGALNGARRASAQNDVTQIANAVIGYETEYGQFPPAGSPTNTVSGDLINALLATSTNNNRRLVRFLEAPNFRTNRGGVTNAGLGNAQYLDPWGGVYQIAINRTYNPTVLLAVGGVNGPPAENLRKSVGVWNTNSNQRRRVGSW